ncbi:MAG: efflux RND transporter periplasmic adaptor subunit [Opitutaceae bacterium]|jgi:Cu(I)/Ag(I) efflux system membrane fusion protein|nr:efflux RND transporter periplasmic adaptor subunit [Opitutaceae bacterium]
MRAFPNWALALAGLLAGAITVTLLPSSALFTATPGNAEPQLGTTSSGARYACPMMDFIGNKPGDCPVCGMTMAPVVAGELTAEQTRRMGLETSVVASGPALATVRAYGAVEYDHRFTRLVIPRVAGRIVQRFEATFGCCEVVEAGAPVIALYSPELIAAQGELQAALKLGDAALVASLRERFSRWNLADLADEIAAGQPVRDVVTIRSPFGGSVLLDDEDMVNEALFVGREIPADYPLLRLVDPDRLTLVVHVPEPRANWIRAGQSVRIDSDDRGPLPQLRAEVGRVTDEINLSLRSREVRIHLTGARSVLSPGSLVSARFDVALGSDLEPADPVDRATWGQFALVPKTAVLSTGTRHVAWKLANPGASGPARFELAPLALGPRLEYENGRDLYVVRAGLSAGDVVATQGAFLLDSQAQLAGTPSLLYPLGATAPAPAHAH